MTRGTNELQAATLHRLGCALAVAVSSLIGVPLGLVSGYLGGWLDKTLVLVTDALYSFPSLLLAIVVSIVVSGGSSGALGGIASAAIATLNASEAILTLAALGFLGFGIEPSATAERGYDLNEAMPDATNDIWWTGLFPGLAIVLVVLGVTLLGESLNDVMNPLLRTRGGDKAECELESELADDLAVDPEIDAPVAMHRGRSAASTDGRDARRTAVLSLSDLRVSFGTDAGRIVAVDGVAFDVEPGEVVAVVGESGSGKSVTSRAVMGLLPSTANVNGSVLLRTPNDDERQLIGMSPGQLRPMRGDEISMIFQEPASALDPVRTVG